MNSLTIENWSASARSASPAADHPRQRSLQCTPIPPYLPPDQLRTTTYVIRNCVQLGIWMDYTPYIFSMVAVIGPGHLQRRSQLGELHSMPSSTVVVYTY